MGFIYQIENLVSGKVYIGSTDRTFQRRKVEHITELRGNYHDNKYLQASWNKYGESSFKFSVIEETDNPEQTHDREKYWVEYYVEMLGVDRLYNIMPIEKSSYGKPRPITEQHLANMRAAQRKRFDNDPNLKDKMREYGKRGIAAQKEKGPIKRSEETRKKIAESAKRKYANGYTRKGYKLTDSAKIKIANAHAKVWDGFIAPDGTIYKNIVNLKAFCREHGLADANMQMLDKYPQRTVKGWRSVHYKEKVRYFGPFVSPDGTIYDNIVSLSAFCKDHGLALSSMSQVETGKVRASKGWTKL